MKLSVRYRVIQAFMFFCFTVLLLALFQTQVMRGSYFRRSSEKNRIRLIRVEAARGNINDCTGIPLATNRPAFNTYIIPEDFDPWDLKELSRLLGMNPEDIERRLGQVRGASYSPVLLKRDVSKDVVMAIEERRPRLTGVFNQIRAIRTYPQGEVGSHIVGYIGKITKEEFEDLDRSIYFYDSWIGRSGIEKMYDLELRGEDGGRQIEVNARGVPIKILSEKEAQAGSDIQLTIDTRLESKIRPLLAGKKAAVLVMDLQTGDVLSAISSPGYDPSAFVVPDRAKERLDVIGSKEKPFLNRAFNGLYPPGSVFKLVTAMAGLESGIITPHTVFHCAGAFRFGPKSRPFKCWFPGGHGRVDLYRALERSCNVYFYNVGRLVGEKRLATYARKLGLGEPIYFDLPNESGTIPDQEWKRMHVRDAWYPGDTVTFAIGQGYVLTSPFQILRLIATIASDGRVVEPRLVNDPLRSPVPPKSVSVHAETFKALKQGMLQVVESDRGTGQMARVNFAKLAAKTGTAQAPPGAAHAWFGGFFPYDNPKIALVVFVERGGSGGLVGAQIAKTVVSVWSDLYGAKVS